MEAACAELMPVVLEAVQAGARVRISVRGGSMWPFIVDGDVVEIEALGPGEPRPGWIVLAVDGDGRYVLHRLVNRSASGALLRGDAHEHLDGPYAAGALLARATGLVRGGRLVPLDRGLHGLAGGAWVRYRPLRVCVRASRKVAGLVRRALRARPRGAL